MPTGVLVSTSRLLNADRLRFGVRNYPDAQRPFVLLVLGSEDVTMHVFDLATMDALQTVVAEAHDLLAAGLAGQDRLPVELTAVRV